MSAVKIKPWLAFLIGMGIVAIADVLVFAFLSIVPGGSDAAMMHIIGIGLTQLVYVIPLFIILRIKQQKTMANGVLTMAGITFLLNSACFGIIFLGGGLGHMH